MADPIVIESRVKAYVRSIEPEFNVGGDLAEAVNKVVEVVLKQAVERTKANGRKTVQGRDV